MNILDAAKLGALAEILKHSVDDTDCDEIDSQSVEYANDEIREAILDFYGIDEEEFEQFCEDNEDLVIAVSIALEVATTDVEGLQEHLEEVL